jgi:hypothetical protein
MIRFAAIAILLAGCRISLENSDTADDSATTRQCTVSTTSQPCMDAVTHSDLAWIEQKIFTASCNFSGCHSSAGDAGKLDLRPGMSHNHLVGVSSVMDPTRKLVVPNDVDASYLMLMVRDVPPMMATPPANAPPGDIGYMPQNSPALCCQKLDALERWIMAGAPSN